MSITKDATRSAPVFAALGDVTRLELIARLSDGEGRSIAQLCDGLDLTRQGVTKHLRVLERAGVVSCSRVGRESRFVIEVVAVEGGREYLVRASEQWDEAIERLRGMIGEPERSDHSYPVDEGHNNEG